MTCHCINFTGLIATVAINYLNKLMIIIEITISVVTVLLESFDSQLLTRGERLSRKLVCMLVCLLCVLIPLCVCVCVRVCVCTRMPPRQLKTMSVPLEHFTDKLTLLTWLS